MSEERAIRRLHDVLGVKPPAQLGAKPISRQPHQSRSIAREKLLFRLGIRRTGLMNE
jgi:hypothetical protein